jgi:hypothetical protein
MTNKYYLLEDVKKPQELISRFTEYQGNKSKLEQTLADSHSMTCFDCGDIKLLDIQQEKRQSHNYTHVLLGGTYDDFARFESFVESESGKIIGTCKADQTELGDLVKTYLPATKTNKLAKLCRETYTHRNKIIDKTLATVVASSTALCPLIGGYIGWELNADARGQGGQFIGIFLGGIFGGVTSALTHLAYSVHNTYIGKKGGNS